MSPILFTIPFINFEVRYYAIMYMIALYFGIYLGKKMAKKDGLSEKTIEDAGTWLIVSGILGARIYYIIMKWDYFKDNLYEIYAIWHGIRGLAIHGGIMGAAVGLFIFTRLRKINFWTLVDIATPMTLIGQAIGRIGNLTNGEAHGVPTFTPWLVILKGNFVEWWQTYLANPLANYPEIVPWGMVFPLDTPAGQEFPNMPIHPTMIYEMILNFIGFLILFFYFRRQNYAKGTIAGLYVIFYGVIRTVVTVFRADDLYFMGIRAPFLANALFIVGGSAIIYLVNKRKST